MLRGPPDALLKVVGAFEATQAAVLIAGVLQEGRPFHLLGRSGQVHILPPAIRHAVRDFFLLGGGDFPLQGRIFIGQFGKAVADGLVAEGIVEVTVQVVDGEVGQAHSGAIIAVGGRVHTAGSAEAGRIHGHHQQGVVHGILRNGFKGIGHTGCVVAAYFGAFAEPGAQGLSFVAISFGRGNHIYRIHVKQLPVRGKRLFLEQGFGHMLHHAVVHAVGHLAVAEGIAHQYHVDAGAFGGGLQHAHHAVPAEVGGMVNARVGQVFVDDGLDVGGIIGPSDGRFIIHIRSFRHVDHQPVVAEERRFAVLGIQGRNAGSHIQMLQVAAIAEGLGAHLLQ